MGINVSYIKDKTLCLQINQVYAIAGHKIANCEQFRIKCCVKQAATSILATTYVFLIKMLDLYRANYSNSSQLSQQQVTIFALSFRLKAQQPNHANHHNSNILHDLTQNSKSSTKLKYFYDYFQ